MTYLTGKAITGKAYENFRLETGSSSLEAKRCNSSNRIIAGF